MTAQEVFPFPATKESEPGSSLLAAAREALLADCVRVMQAVSMEEFYGNRVRRQSLAMAELRVVLKRAGGDPDARSGVVRDGVRRPA